jgi:hypothetical protein
MEFKYRRLVVKSDEINHIKQLIKDHPSWSRRKLSKQVCEDFNWRQENGYLKDMVCRSFLLVLDRSGIIKLPPIKFRPNNPLTNRQKPAKVLLDETPIFTKDNIKIVQVRSTPDEHLYDSLIEHYHYLGYVYPVGEYLKYIFFNKERPLGCICFSSAVRHIKCRDDYIGWTKEQREAHIHLTAYNTRFLLLPWVSINCLASQLLSQTVKIVSKDWERYFNHPLYYLETFVDTERFAGTCYKAANWRYLGTTTGRGKNDQSGKVNRSIKAVLGYPLSRNFREVLQNG